MKKMNEKAMRKAEGGYWWMYCKGCRKFAKIYTYVGVLAAIAGHKSHNSGGEVLIY